MALLINWIKVLQIEKTSMDWSNLAYHGLRFTKFVIKVRDTVSQSDRTLYRRNYPLTRSQYWLSMLTTLYWLEMILRRWASWRKSWLNNLRLKILELEVLSWNGSGKVQKWIMVFQHKYVLNLLLETRMIECKPSDSPIHANGELGEVKDGSKLIIRCFKSDNIYIWWPTLSFYIIFGGSQV